MYNIVMMFAAVASGWTRSWSEIDKFIKELERKYNITFNRYMITDVKQLHKNTSSETWGDALKAWDTWLATQNLTLHNDKSLTRRLFKEFELLGKPVDGCKECLYKGYTFEYLQKVGTSDAYEAAVFCKCSKTHGTISDNNAIDDIRWSIITEDRYNEFRIAAGKLQSEYEAKRKQEVKI